MPELPMALTGVLRKDLEQLLRFVYREELDYPLTPATLARVGLQHRSEELLGCLRGLDGAGVRAVVVAVIAERMAADKRAELSA